MKIEQFVLLWNYDCNRVVEELKIKLIFVLVLGYFDFFKEFVLEIDVSL